jgi:hypothetical protein
MSRRSGILITGCLAITALMTTSVVANEHAVFYKFADWDRMKETVKRAYVAGAIDSMLIFGSDAASDHYQQCIQESNLSLAQITSGISALVVPRPDLQNAPVELAIVVYLRELCGPPPPDHGSKEEHF